MKKILAAFDGTNYSEGASKYAIEIARRANALLVGVFIQDMRYLNLTYAYAWDQPFIDFTSLENSEQVEKGTINSNMKLFHRACEEKEVQHKIHLDKGVPLQELVNESVFADLILIDSQTSFFSFGDRGINTFLKDFLIDSHCPVLIVPQGYTVSEKAVLCYDGSPSSVYAIKMFSYLFPESNNLKTNVVTVNKKSTDHLKDGWNFKDLVRVHFDNVAYTELTGNAEEELITYLKTNGQNSIVVMGAYGGSAISRLFHQSISNRVILEVSIPVFITHF